MSANSKKHIMLVDDDRHLVIALSDYLTYEGFEVTQALSGEEALRKLEKAQPDLIILDISMPGMGGVGFLRRIADADGAPRYPVLVFTARGSMEEFFDSLDVDGFLAKPCSEADLLRQIREILVRRASAVRPPPTQKQRKALLAEDDVDVAKRLTEAFEAAGFTVTLARSGPEVLQVAPSAKPDVVVIKEVLPKMNGSVVASLITTMPTTAKTPVILYDETRTDGGAQRFRYRAPAGVTRVLTTAEPAAITRTVVEVTTPR